MAEHENVIWTTTTKVDAQAEVRIVLTKDELTIEMTEESIERIDKKGRKFAEKVMNVFLPYKVKIKDIRKVKREPKKIVIATGFFKRCGIGMPEPEISQLEAEMNRLIN
jgi:hypothetical protein